MSIYLSLYKICHTEKMPNGNIFIYHSFRILENIFAIEKVCSLNEFKSGRKAVA